MKNDKIHRAIPVQVSDECPDGFIRVEECQYCEFRYENCQYKDECGLECFIIPDSGIDSRCPLLTVAQVREYPASEKPGRGKIHIKYKINNRETWGTGWMLIYDWHVEGKGIVPNEDVISWRNLPERELPQ